jgi:hypothetical protein
VSFSVANNKLKHKIFSTKINLMFGFYQADQTGQENSMKERS